MHYDSRCTANPISNVQVYPAPIPYLWQQGWVGHARFRPAQAVLEPRGARSSLQPRPHEDTPHPRSMTAASVVAAHTERDHVHTHSTDHVHTHIDPTACLLPSDNSPRLRINIDRHASSCYWLLTAAAVLSLCFPLFFLRVSVTSAVMADVRL